MTAKRRWIDDGGDFHTGSSVLDKNGLPRGNGGMVAWMVGQVPYRAYVWRKDSDRSRGFKSADAAKRWVERWLTKWAK